MKKIAGILIFCLTWVSLSLNAQDIEDVIDPMPIKLRGQILNIADGNPVPYAHVVNMRTHGGTTTDAEGKFTLNMMNVDSLAFSAMGFKKMYIKVKPTYKDGELFTIQVAPVRFAIDEVEVKGEKNKLDLGLPEATKLDISPELRGASFNKKPSVLAAVFAPVSFLQYHTSKKEKEKRNVRQAMISEEQWQKISKYYTKDIVMDITGLNEAKADTFMLYFNSKGILTSRSSEYDIRVAIEEQYKLWEEERQEK